MPARLPLPIAILFLTLCPAMSAVEASSVWQGAYTAAQAARGETVYAAECSRCHRDDLSGYRALLIGERFLNDWREDHLDSFFTRLKKTMPRNAPASLSDGEYLDLIAYILQANAFPAGSGELTTNVLSTIRIEGRQGPEPVPNFALVAVTGCLVQTPGGEWMLTAASEPVRTRNPAESPAGETISQDIKASRTHTFRLMDATVMRVPKKDQEVEAKGFLMRKPGDDSINITSLQPLGPACSH